MIPSNRMRNRISVLVRVAPAIMLVAGAAISQYHDTSSSPLLSLIRKNYNPQTPLSTKFTLTLYWSVREKELLDVLDKYRKNDGNYDCIVSGSGGKDSALASHLLKYKYNMHPLTVTWPPVMYTDYGYRNFRNWKCW